MLVKSDRRLGGKAEKIEKLGKRRLAYIVNKFREGSYVLFTIQADGAIIREVERRLRVMDLVIKYLTVRMDDDMKRLAKIKAHRQKRAAHRGRARGEASDRQASDRRGPSPAEQMPEE